MLATHCCGRPLKALLACKPVIGAGQTCRLAPQHRCLVRTNCRSGTWTMGWITKAAIQNTVCLLPKPVSLEAYYQIQRRFGALRRLRIERRLRSGIEVFTHLKENGFDPVGGEFLEVGTGRVPLAPLAYWLLGADRVVTMDLNPYLKSELLLESLDYISENWSEIGAMFGADLHKARYDALLSFARQETRPVGDLLKGCNIEYMAPADARSTGRRAGSVDFHVSFTVMEHIPRADVVAILREAKRLLSPGGACLHMIDYSDHFSHSDDSISAVNFLKFSDRTWRLIAGNPFMYMNRLRHDDFLDLYSEAGHEILGETREVDSSIREAVDNNDIPLATRYRGKAPEVLATTAAWVLSRPAEAGRQQAQADE